MYSPHRTNLYHQRGFQMLEMVIVLTMLVSLMSFGSRYLQYNLQQATNEAIAHQLRQVTKAAYQYVQDEYISVSNFPKPITIKDLVAKGFLGKQVLEKNLYDQSYKIEVIPSGPEADVKSLQVLVTTDGGRSIDEASIRAIASKVGGEGGYSSITMPGKIVGSAGIWEINAPGIQDGHLASLTVVNEKDVMANYYVSDGDQGDLLHRVKVDGHPEYNKMEADLEIGTNNMIYFKDGVAIKDKELSYTADNGSAIKLTGNSTGGELNINNKDSTNIQIKHDGIYFKNGTKFTQDGIYFSKGLSVLSDRILFATGTRLFEHGLFFSNNDSFYSSNNFKITQGIYGKMYTYCFTNGASFSNVALVVEDAKRRNFNAYCWNGILQSHQDR